MRDFRSLKVWEKSHQLTLNVYRSTQNFPADERFGLTSQIRRAASSIPANIAEGCGRNTERELAQFMQISMGSASELEYHLLLSRDLKYLNEQDYQALNDATVEVKRMLAPFINRLRGKS
ncbi:MAG: four helix bundle protein [Chloroflexota bacterium]